MCGVSTRIAYGDTVYDTIHEAWVLNNYTATFDRQGEWGGARYKVLDTSASNPDFYQVSSMHATTFNEESPHEKPLHEGWHLQNRNYHRLKARWTYDGRIKITAPEIPDELTPEETV